MYNFDGPNKLVILSTTSFDAKDLYSRWKDWMILTDNAKYEQAMQAVGGEPTSATNFVPSFYFMINGWKIRPSEADQTLTVTGNLANEGGIGSPFVSTLGSFNVLIEKNTSDSQTVSTGSSSGSGGDITVTTGPQLQVGPLILPLGESTTVTPPSGDAVYDTDVYGTGTYN